jgi:DNA ligase-1
MQGSGSKPYVLRNVGGVYSCSCPAWRNQSIAIEKRTCKHLRKLSGDEAAFSIRPGFVTVPYGRTGSNGETYVKSFANEVMAQAHADKLIGEKMEKG